jgi:hypothetical protein
MNEELGTLEATIVSHAAELADKEWRNEQRTILFGLLENCGLAARLNERTGDLVDPGTLTVDGREIPIEAITNALHEQFISHRKKKLVEGLTRKLVEQAGRKIFDEEHKQ